MSNRTQSSNKTLQRRVLDLGKIVLLAGILVTVGLLSAIVGMRFAVRRSEVEVPSVVGKSVAEAEKSLAHKDLKLHVSGERYDPSVSKGLILTQYPVGGGQIKAQREVQVVLSRGDRASPVPNLTGSTVRVAQLTAVERGYEVGTVSEIAFPGAGEGRVFQQFPPPGSTVVVSPRINLLVSSGARKRFVMPELVGRNLNEAKAVFNGQNFELSRIDYRFYSNVGKGIVVRQSPEAGYLLDADDAISVEVAR